MRTTCASRHVIRHLTPYFHAVGSPAGLNITSDEELYRLLADLEAWKTNLPEDLQFRGPESPRSAGMSYFAMEP